ncbi:unnamed protein product [Schistosoma bovis]|nr:unnamed protein product [Schistosoma bovis]
MSRLTNIVITFIILLNSSISHDPIETTTAMGITNETINKTNMTEVIAEFNTTEQTTNTEDPNAENTNSGLGRIMLYILAGLFILAILAAIVGCIVLRLKK